MAAKHTPGPWTVIGGAVFGNGLRAALPMNAADANLMAAAPDLLAALRWAVEQIEDSLDPEHAEALDAARALIDRIEGRA